MWPWASHLALLSAESFQSCLTLCNPMDSSLPGSSARHFSGKNAGVGCHVLFQGIFQTQGTKPRLKSPALAGRFFTTSSTREAVSYLPNQENTNSPSRAVMRNILFYFIFRPYHMACGILVPLPGVEPKPAALGARSLSPWATR